MNKSVVSSVVFSCAAMILMEGCDSLDNLVTDLEHAAEHAANGIESSASASTSSCGYTVAYRYDLAGIDIDESFTANNVQASSTVIQSSAINCPYQVSIPRVGYSTQGTVYELTNNTDVINLYSSSRSIPVQLLIGPSPGPANARSIAMAQPNSSDGFQSVIFNGGTLTAHANAYGDAYLVVTVSYYYVTR